MKLFLIALFELSLFAADPKEAVKTDSKFITGSTTLTPAEKAASDPAVILAQRNNWQAIGQMQYYLRIKAESSLTAEQAQQQADKVNQALPALTAAIKAACKKVDPTLDVDQNGVCVVPSTPPASK
jgi:hypothetical protein